MERTQVIVIAVVVAAVALFGLRIWSDRSVDELTVGGRSANGVAGLESGFGSDADGNWDGRGGPGGAHQRGAVGSQVGSSSRGGLRGDGTRNSGPAGRGPGPVDLARADGLRGGGSLGASGGSLGGRGGTAGSASVSGNLSDSGISPKVKQKADLVDFLSSQPPTTANLGDTKNSDGTDVALKVDKPEDIASQDGQDTGVQKPEDGDGIKITDRGKVEFPNYASGDAGTISFQIQPDWAGSDPTDNALVQIRQEHQWNNGLELVKNGEFLRFIVRDNTGKEADISVRISDWQPGDLHDIRASWGPSQDGTPTTQLYIDGRLAGSNTYNGAINFNSSTPMFLGGDYAGSAYSGANATLRDVTLKNTATF
jgi:Concanavalin A-like lectin/glucanases superfamily